MSVAESRYPSKLYVETTTRCNLRCPHCVKQSSGSAIGEGDLDPAVFAQLEPVFPHLRSLVLTGIGEPLLHPRLEDFVATARRSMTGRIGFQTNGLLMTKERAQGLISAGLDTVCVSVDASDPEVLSAMRGRVRVSDLEDALANILQAAAESGRDGFTLGVEVVLVESNLDALPDLVDWAAGRGVNYMLASHLLPYAAGSAASSLIGPNTREALEFYARLETEAREKGLEPARFYQLLGKYELSPDEKHLMEFMAAKRRQARQQGVPFNLAHVLDHDPALLERMRGAFAEAEARAESAGLDLRLPQATPLLTRSCAFVEDGAAFVDVQGEVSPCSFLWHTYACHYRGVEKQVSHHSFGNVLERSLADIWTRPEYVDFRQQVLRFDMPHCASCPSGPCSDVRATQDDFVRDCYGSTVPCGHCPWGTGGFQCL